MCGLWLHDHGLATGVDLHSSAAAQSCHHMMLARNLTLRCFGWRPMGLSHTQKTSSACAGFNSKDQAAAAIAATTAATAYHNASGGGR